MRGRARTRASPLRSRTLLPSSSSSSQTVGHRLRRRQRRRHRQRPQRPHCRLQLARRRQMLRIFRLPRRLRPGPRHRPLSRCRPHQTARLHRQHHPRQCCHHRRLFRRSYRVPVYHPGHHHRRATVRAGVLRSRCITARVRPSATDASSPSRRAKTWSSGSTCQTCRAGNSAARTMKQLQH